MKPTHIEHIGIAVNDLQESIALFEKLLGTPCYAIEEVPDQKVRTAFFRVGESKIELLASTSPEGPIGRHLAKRGEGVHHLAFAVENVGKALGDLQESGIQLIDARPRAGAEGMAIAFLHPKSTNGVLTELCGRE